MRKLAIVMIACVAASSLVHAAGTIDLNLPGALAALEHNNPAHYRKVTRILDEVSRQQVEDVPQWLATTFDAEQVRYAPLLMISNPPKRDLAFTLDDTRYEVRVTLTSETYRSIPLVR